MRSSANLINRCRRTLDSTASADRHDPCRQYLQRPKFSMSAGYQTAVIRRAHGGRVACRTFINHRLHYDKGRTSEGGPTSLTALLQRSARASTTCRSFATISSGLYRFLAIAVLLNVKDIPQVGPLQWGRIRSSRGGQRSGRPRSWAHHVGRSFHKVETPCA